MADRQLPELQTRLRVDARDIDKASKKADEFQSRLKRIGSADVLGQSSTRLKAFADRTDELGGKLTRNLTLPLTAAGVVAGKLTTDFNRTFTEAQTLAGVAADEVAGLKEQVKGLAVETGQSPQKLAEALYFIRSSGVEGAAALETLQASAKAAAIGLGDAAQVADVVTSALNAYGSENLSATQAVDQLAAAVQQGKGEAAAFAPQLGALLPIAQKLGVGFDQVSGSVAFLTQTNGDVARSATAVAGVLQKLQAPSQSGAKVLEDVGLSAGQLRKVLAEQGLIAALQLLDKRLGGNSESLRKVFDDIEGFNGALALLRNGGVDAAKVIDSVTNSSGKLATAFKVVQDTDEFRVQQALAELQAVGIDVGEKLLPVLADLADKVADLADVFDMLPGPVQNSLVGLVAVAWALGPIVKTASVAASGLSSLFKAVESEKLARLGADGSAAASGLSGLSKAGFAAGAGLAAFGITLTVLEQLSSVDVDTRALTTDLQQLADGAATASDVAKTLQTDVNGLARAFVTAAGAPEDFRQALGYLGGNLIRNQGGLDLGGVDLVQAKNRVEIYDKALGDMVAGGNVEGARKAFGEMALALHEQGLGYDEIAALLPNYFDQLDRAERGANDKTDADKGLTEQQKALQDMLDGTTGALGGQTDELEKARQAADDFFAASQQSDETGQAVADAMRELADARAAASGNSEEYSRALADQASAEKALRAAQDDSRIAQEALGDARRQAAEDLQQLQFSAEGAALAEESAQIALDRAKDDALKARTKRDRQDADLRIRQADLALRQAKDRNGDTAQQLAEAQAKGIEGSDAVVAAQQRITDARDAEREAQARLADATKSASQVLVDAQQRVKDATEKLIDAQLSHIDAQVKVVELTDGAASSTDVMIDALSRLASKLSANDPLRQNLVAYVRLLREARDLSEPGNGGNPGPRTGGFGFGTVASSVTQVLTTTAPTKNLTAPSSVPVPTVAPPQPSTFDSQLPPVEVTVNVTGQPDAATIAQIEQVAGRTVEKALRKVAVG